MNKLLSTALAIAIVTGASTSHADVILTEENMDLITAGLALNSYSISATDLSSATSIIIGDTTLMGRRSGDIYTITIRTSAGHTNTCTSCSVMLTQSGITVADTSGHVWYAWTGMPQNYPITTLVTTILAP